MRSSRTPPEYVVTAPSKMRHALGLIWGGGREEDEDLTWPAGRDGAGNSDGAWATPPPQLR